ncbi:hypothetical protein QCA50_004398 [Cerrena zonata]|uniref:Terpenoid synthase n=1 Tax=Cerrena zonata TaxID=2478898 RepID=A0AAW0GNX6_9APHY
MDVAFSRRFVLDFLERTHFADRFPPRTAPPVVEAKARDIMRSWKLDISETTFEQYFVIGLDIGYAAYQHTPHAVQVATTLFTVCAALCDDVVATDIQAMREFIPRICTGQPQLDPILSHFIEMASEVRKYLPDYTANMVHTCMMGFANEELCIRQDVNQLTLKPDAGTYIKYSRYKNGLSEIFAACIWPSTMCPDVAEYIQAFP